MKILISFLILLVSFPVLAAEKESAFERILRTGVIRCGYYVFPPVTYRDPNTGELRGFSVDYMNRIAERAALKVEWVAEVTWANWIPEIQAGRFDVACTPMWPELTMLKAVTFTTPIFFAGLYPLVRNDDERFLNAGIDRLNQPDVTIITQEGNATDAVARAIFPNAKYHVLPATASGGEYYQALTAKKGDATLTDPNGLWLYEEQNGKHFKFIDENNPVKLQSSPMAVARKETELLTFLNQAIHEMDYSGETDRLLRKWETEPGKMYLRVASPVKVQ